MGMIFEEYEIKKEDVKWGDTLTYTFKLAAGSTPALGFTPSCGCSTVSYDKDKGEVSVVINTTAAASEGMKGTVSKSVTAYADDGQEFMRKVSNHIYRPFKQRANLICTFTLV